LSSDRPRRCISTTGTPRHQVRIVAQRRHVIHDARAGVETGAHHASATRVDRHQHALPRQALDDRQDTVQFFVGFDRPRSGPRRLAPDIDDVSALRNKTQAIVNGLRGVEAFAAIGK
jgi:hypothetical protein